MSFSYSASRVPSRLLSACVAFTVMGELAHAGNPWADSVQYFSQGSGANPLYAQPATALGEPTRFTGAGVFPSAVTPFNPPFLDSEIVSIGQGGSLIVQFDEPVLNDPLNPFGIDLLIFGNAFFEDQAYPNGKAGSLFGAGGTVEVSIDGFDWKLLPGIQPDGLYPTIGYADVTDPYATSPGAALTDFTRPVDPSFNPAGLTYSQILAGYAGSGGGAGIDLSAVNLASISFVRISNLATSGTVEIDAFADVTAVPTPGVSVGLLLGLSTLARRRREFR